MEQTFKRYSEGDRPHCTKLLAFYISYLILPFIIAASVVRNKGGSKKSGVEDQGQNSNFLTPVKIRGGWRECLAWWSSWPYDRTCGIHL